MGIMNYTERRVKSGESKAVISTYPVILTAGYTKEQVEAKLKSIKEKKRLQDIVGRLRRFDSQCKLYTLYWKNLFIPQEIIDIRMEVAKELFEVDCTLSHEELKQKYIGLPLSRFEKKLALEVAEKAGIDRDYYRSLDYKAYMVSINEKYEETIDIPEMKVAENPELKNKEEIKKFIKDRLEAFYERKFSYPEDEKPEEPIETIGL